MFSSNASAAADDANYIEEVFQTWLYTGNSSTQTITNGIDLAGKGGLVWIKGRTTAFQHVLVDTVRGPTKYLQSNSTSTQATAPNTVPSFSASGFTAGTDNQVNLSGDSFASWTFRKQPKFFDVVTYTGDGQTFRTVNHNLGAKPGFIICKCTSTTSDWSVLAKMSGGGDDDFIPLNLNSTAASRYGSGLTVAVSSTLFYTADLGFDGASNDQLRYNQNGATYVAYLFAHNAGGFGLTGTDNVISCGSYTGNGSTTGPTVTLGYEPQWLLVKKATGGAGYDWCLFDNMRGLPVGGNASVLFPNSSIAETTITSAFALSATGFNIRTDSAYLNESGTTYIYMAIRRGPMKVPTTGTSVFLPNDGTGSTSGQTISTAFPVDLAMSAYKTQGFVASLNDRLRGISNANSAGTTPALQTSTTQAESAFSSSNPWFINAWNNSITRGSNGADPSGGIVTWLFGRAPGYFDEVCYTGAGSATTFSHNLGVVPQLIIFKMRSGTRAWPVYDATNGNSGYSVLSSDSAWAGPDASVFNNTSPTSSVFTVNTSTLVNGSGSTYVAYLFATCPGVSKVGSYTGNGSSQTINCGFTGGARFVMIKRTDDTGDWYVWDTARGIVSGNDPHLSLNTTAAEVTTDDTIDTDSTGFVVNQVSATNVNVSSATYIFLAIA